MTIYIDAMGGDHAPKEIVKGAVEAVKEYNVPVTLVGKKEAIEQELIAFGFDDPRITIMPAESVIGFNEEPVQAVRHKKDSSIVTALTAMKEDPNSVLISAGSTGALLVGGQLLLGRIKGVKRPGLGTVFPQGKDRKVFVIDVGASSDSKPDYLLTYAKLAKIYSESVLGETNPKIGLINVGTEAEKGSMLAKEAHTLLENSGLNFAGNVEARDIPTTPVNILVCDGFTGNVVLKLTEGLMSFILHSIKDALLGSVKGKLGALLIKDDLKAFKDAYNPDEYGGSPLLGIKGGIIKAHGSSGSYAIKNTVKQAMQFQENHVVELLSKEMETNA